MFKFSSVWLHELEGKVAVGRRMVGLGIAGGQKQPRCFGPSQPWCFLLSDDEDTLKAGQRWVSRDEPTV